MIYGKVLNAMTEEELRKYTKSLEEVVSAQGVYGVAQTDYMNAQFQANDARKRMDNYGQMLDEKKEALREVCASFEEKYRELMPKLAPEIYKQTYEQITKGDTK